MKDRIVPESPAKLLRQGWKKPQAVRQQVPSVAQFEAIVADSTGTTLSLASATTSIVNLAGTYGAAGSGAMYTNIADFTGTGELSVVPEPST